MKHWQGGCLCGAVRYQCTDAPTWASYCHCWMCRRTSGAPYTSFVQFEKGEFQWAGSKRRRYQSSEVAQRGFCGSCGSNLTFEVDGLVFITLGSLDHPEKVQVQQHVYTQNRLPGVKTNDGLPEFAGPFGGKGGLALDDEAI